MHDELSVVEALELLRQARFDLSRCKKSLAFKENLLQELEIEIRELYDKNRQLEESVADHQRRERRRLLLESNFCDEEISQDDQFDNFAKPQISYFCENCQRLEDKQNELYDTIDEMSEQKERLSDVNKLLLENLNLKTTQLKEMTDCFLTEKATRERLEANVDFLVVEKELLERDFRDFRKYSSSRDLLEIDSRGVSIGSSIGQELGLNRSHVNFGEACPRPSIDWNNLTRNFELSCLEEGSDSRIRDSLDTIEKVDDFGNYLFQQQNVEELQDLPQIETTPKGGTLYRCCSKKSLPKTKTPEKTSLWDSLMCFPFRRRLRCHRSPASSTSSLCRRSSL